MGKEEDEGRIQGIKVSRGAPAISHLLYADDILVACKANTQNASSVAQLFKTYNVWSGQEVSTEKSRIFFSANTPRIMERVIKDFLGFIELGAGSIYLGNSLIFVKSGMKEFGKLRDRIQGRMEGWQSQLLSKACKSTLIR